MDKVNRVRKKGGMYMVQESKKSSKIESRVMSRVSEAERQSWISIAFLWIGTMICIPML